MFIGRLISQNIKSVGLSLQKGKWVLGHLHPTRKYTLACEETAGSESWGNGLKTDAVVLNHTET
jgi:hypothetical protein